MTPPLFFVDSLEPARVVLSGPEGHHAARVKRLNVGEVVWLADGTGAVAQARVSSVGSDRVAFEIEIRSAIPSPDPRFVVVQALAKGDRGELAVELLTELGVDEIVPWSASRSIAQWRSDRADRGLAKWRRTATEAAKQCRRVRVPIITDLMDTNGVLTRLSAVGSFVLQEDVDAALTEATVPATGDVVLIVGPEGGISPQELTAFIGAGAQPVKLGGEVMRTSTAGAAAIAVLSTLTGRWNRYVPPGSG